MFLQFQHLTCLDKWGKEFNKSAILFKRRKIDEIIEIKYNTTVLRVKQLEKPAVNVSTTVP